MSRTLTTGMTAAVTGQQSEYLHLLALEFAAGTLRLTTAPHDVSWNSQTWYASKGGMSFEAASETPDPSGQRLRIILDGVNRSAINALLNQDYMGRFGTLYLAHMKAGQILADPIILFLGYMNGSWDVTEDIDERWAKVETELVSPLAVLEQRRGIVADPLSHQRIFSGDTFFDKIATKPQGDFGWGPFQAGSDF